MKTYKELIIKSKGKETLIEVLQKIISNLPADWKYKSDYVEDYSKNVSKDEKEIGCFESPLISSNKGLIWFVIWEDELKIVNITPESTGQLSFDEYNQILDRFYTDCISKVVSENINIIKTEGDYNVPEIAGDKTYQALELWERLCHHSEGNLHTLDLKRWLDFISIAFKEKSKLTPELFSRWLIEEKNWNDNDLVSKLASDYEYGISILEHYVENY